MTNYGLNVEQVRNLVVKPALYALEPVIGYSANAENLVLGTFLQESDGLRALKQYDGGPAVGLLQMEPGTHESLWIHSIPGIKNLAGKLLMLLAGIHMTGNKWPDHSALATNLLYAAAMCRVRYYIVPERLPLQNDPMALATYWTRFYNAGGKGTVAAALPHFQRATKYEESP